MHNWNAYKHIYGPHGDQTRHETYSIRKRHIRAHVSKLKQRKWISLKPFPFHRISQTYKGNDMCMQRTLTRTHTLSVGACIRSIHTRLTHTQPTIQMRCVCEAHCGSETNASLVTRSKNETSEEEKTKTPHSTHYTPTALALKCNHSFFGFRLECALCVCALDEFTEYGV